MGLWASSLQRSAQVRALTFSSRPYYRIMLGCIQELGPKPGQEQTGVANLATLAQVLLEVQPLRVPSFTFAWLELVSHRYGHLQEWLGMHHRSGRTHRNDKCKSHAATLILHIGRCKPCQAALHPPLLAISALRGLECTTVQF